MHDLPDHAADADTVDLLCDQYEAALRRGGQVDLWEFVSRCDPRLHDRLVADLLDLDLHYSRAHGKPMSREGYLAQYPRLRAHIEAFDFRRGIEPGDVFPLSNSVDHLGPGSCLGRYQLEEEIGRGAMGVVWRALDPPMQRIVAIKTPTRLDLSDDEMRRFLREGRCASRLEHPHIVRLNDAGRDGPHAYLVYEFVEGRSLSEELKQGPLAPRAAASLCARLAAALHHAHGCGVIHRDVKPANVLLNSNGEPRLTDFGLARLRHDSGLLTLDRCVLGTPAYMAPEQARGEQTRVDHRADIYGLGALLMTLLTGRAPYEGDAQAVVLQVCDATEGLSPRSVNKTVPRDLDAVCRRATEPDPHDRYPDAATFADELDRFVHGEPPLARVPSRLRLAWRRMRRRPKDAVIGALSLVLLALVTLTMVAWPRGEFRDVVMDVTPPQARIAFVPLDGFDGTPRQGDAVVGRGVGTVTARLPPGMYFVVAVTRDGRFHEVYRWIPSRSQSLSAGARLVSRLDEQGRLELAGIAVPPRDPPRGATLFSGSERFVPGATGAADADSMNGAVAVRPFFMDETEFTLAEARGLFSTPTGRLPAGRSRHAYTANFFEALTAAELAGKRLPSEIEYEFAATGGGTRRYPWGNEFPAGGRTGSFGAVGGVPLDRNSDEGDVRGLCSNVAEWTVSVGPLAEGTLNDYRVVRGGDRSVLAGDPAFTARSRDPLNRCVVPPYTSSQGLGFRCVRSLAPLLDFDEMR